MLLRRERNKKRTSNLFFCDLKKKKKKLDPSVIFHLVEVQIYIFSSCNRKKSLEGMKRKHAEAEEDNEVEDPGMQNDQAAAVESDDEAEYYRQAVGEEPDEGVNNYSTINH